MRILGHAILQNARHERFAQLVASGKYSDMEAFKQAGYSANSAQQNAHGLSENEGVKARIAELKVHAMRRNARWRERRQFNT